MDDGTTVLVSWVWGKDAIKCFDMDPPPHAYDLGEVFLSCFFQEGSNHKSLWYVQLSALGCCWPLAVVERDERAWSFMIRWRKNICVSCNATVRPM